MESVPAVVLDVEREQRPSVLTGHRSATASAVTQNSKSKSSGCYIKISHTNQGSSFMENASSNTKQHPEFFKTYQLQSQTCLRSPDKAEIKEVDIGPKVSVYKPPQSSKKSKKQGKELSRSCVPASCGSEKQMPVVKALKLSKLRHNGCRTPLSNRSGNLSNNGRDLNK